MKIATVIARVLLGLVFVVFGSNIFLHFIPMPPPPPGLLGDFTKALFLSHYLHVVAIFQIVGGLLLLVGRLSLSAWFCLLPLLSILTSFTSCLTPAGCQWPPSFRYYWSFSSGDTATLSEEF